MGPSGVWRWDSYSCPLPLTSSHHAGGLQWRGFLPPWRGLCLTAMPAQPALAFAAICAHLVSKDPYAGVNGRVV